LQVKKFSGNMMNDLNFILRKRSFSKEVDLNNIRSITLFKEDKII